MKQPTSWQRVGSIECDIMTSSGNNVIIFTHIDSRTDAKLLPSATKLGRR